MPPRPAPGRFPWDDALALGLGALGWRPRDFWSATPREFAAALGRRAGPEPLTRAAFARLLAAHPDPP
ncbi:phage tail assembly chaperone [Methylobacterium radiotolerans]|uniref:phage tail assembly chaperone n=1 Tax=Methylobacterium radiotolerans TaxID=31998 RepID=UPI0009D70EE9|nr:phage tail assembly chaperone [Methylobacterium radiotolerans]